MSDISAAARHAVIALAALYVLVLIMGGFNLWATHDEVQTALANRAADHAAVCRAWEQLADLVPPARDAYDVALQQHFEALVVSHDC